MNEQNAHKPAKDFILDEWDWDEEELSYISSLDDAKCRRLVLNMKRADLYSKLFNISKYSIFVLFISVYTLRYFNQYPVSVIIQMVIIPVGILAVFSYFMLRKAESNPDYRYLFLDEG